MTILVLYPSRSDVCADASSFCGIRNKLFPDRRAMGFPLDRQIPSAATFADFAGQVPNMNLGQCRIIHSNRFVARAQ